MSQTAIIAKRLDMLDLLRGLAAQLVVLNHIRATFFVDFGETSARDPLSVAFYTATGFGHQAVIIFFVLSGFLVGGAGWRAYLSQNWHPYSFFLRRLTRLWLVLVPALVLTLTIDAIGRTMVPSLYIGEFFALFTSGPDPSSDLDASRSTWTFLGNVIFLQTIEFPVFGTNSPLWSLSNEFWYYALFILGLTAAATNLNMIVRLVAFLLIVWLAAYLPGHILGPGLVWLAGAIVALGLQTVLHRRSGDLTLIAAASVFFCAMLASRFGVLSGFGNLGSDIVIGAATALLVMAIAQRAQLPQRLARIAVVMAEYSYSLYLIHFPVVMFVAATFFEGRQVTLSATTFLMFAVIFIVVNLLAYLFYLTFEAHTVKVQRTVVSLIGRRPKPERSDD